MTQILLSTTEYEYNRARIVKYNSSKFTEKKIKKNYITLNL